MVPADRRVFHFAGDDRSGVTRVLLTFAGAPFPFRQTFVLEPEPMDGEVGSDWLRRMGASVEAPLPGRLSRLRTYRRVLKPGTVAVAHIDSDVVWSYLARRAGMQRDVRWVAMRHNTGNLAAEPSRGWGGYWPRFLAQGYRTADCTVAVGPDVKSDLEVHGIRSVEIRNPVDLDALGRMPLPVDAGRRLLFMGRLNLPDALVYKDLETVLHALALAKACGLRLMVAGDGPRQPFYETLARDLGLSGNVEFLGWTDPMAAMADSGVVILSSRGPEGYPMVGAEALAAGRTLVFSSGCGMSQFSEVGLPFAEGDPAALASVLRAVATTTSAEAEIAARRGRLWAGEHHDPQRWARRWSQVLRG